MEDEGAIPAYSNKPVHWHVRSIYTSISTQKNSREEVIEEEKNMLPFFLRVNGGLMPTWTLLPTEEPIHLFRIT